MSGSENSFNNTRGLKPYMSPAGAWAVALGTSIGWGSLVVTSNTYLMQAGPAGSIIGLLIGAAVMLIISRNYHYMINCFPDAGGAYAYAKETFGYDFGFLVSWFLSLTYASMLWANATSLPLFARYFIGDIFRKGRLYTIFSYDVYLGEALLTIMAIVLIAFICTRHRELTMSIMVALAAVVTIGITLTFISASVKHGSSGLTYEPGYIPDKSSLSQIVKIACISPWAFIGFENISHSAEEFTFSRSRLFRILTAAVLTATVLYIFVIMLSVSAYPPEYGSWREYIADLGSLSGIKGLPAFYAANYYMGHTGITILILVLLGLIVTSLIGNTVALSRLLYALAKDNVVPGRFAELNNHHVPSRTILLIALLSLPVPFLGRTAIGWIVDVTTIGATLIYGFVSASTVKIARIREDRKEELTGRIGLVLMVLVACYLLLPNFFKMGSMEKETFFLFVVWGILGFIFFRNILARDSEKRFGKSVVVWIALLSLVLMIALIWMTQSMMSSANTAMTNIHEYYTSMGSLSEARLSDEIFIEMQLAELRSANTHTIMGATGMFAFAIAILLTNYTYMNKRQRESEEALGHARAIAYQDPLTGVKNKRAFEEQEHNIDENIGTPLFEDFSVVVCDVNGLKHINDTYGHKAGDEYIRSACRMICDIYQHSPVFRIGGDEFTIILTGKDHESRIDLLEELARRIEANVGTENVVVSAGMADYEPDKDSNFHSVFVRADGIMYKRKQELKSMGAISR